jgi:hypothetical protein
VGEKRDADKEISTISSRLFTKLYGTAADDSLSSKKQSSNQWHADISFEPVPAERTTRASGLCNCSRLVAVSFHSVSSI